MRIYPGDLVTFIPEGRENAIVGKYERSFRTDINGIDLAMCVVTSMIETPDGIMVGQEFHVLLLKLRKYGDLPPFGGDDDITQPEHFIGRWVTFMLAGGIVVAGVQVTDVENYMGELRFRYKLPQCLGVSACSFHSIAYLYVHALSEMGYQHGPTIHRGELALCGHES